MSRNNKKSSGKTIGLCSICETYHKEDNYTIKRIFPGKEPQVICNTCLNSL